MSKFFRFALTILLFASLAACSSLTPPPTPTRSLLEVRGQSLFDSYCSRCHGTRGETIVVGPNLSGISIRGGNRVAGMDARTYIRDSILNPDAYTVEGFAKGIMPVDLKEQLAPEDMEAIEAYLLTLN